MSINKKTLFGRVPDGLGVKDAVHVACVSLRAAQLLNPGQEITLNEAREAIPCNSKSKSFGVVDPFLGRSVKRGENFWGLLSMHEVPNVRHVWEHPDFTFEAPTTEVKYNSTIQSYADDLKVSYQELMDACDKMEKSGTPTIYKGELTEEEFESASEDTYDLWSEWSEESGIEFENVGTACCPEYDYPSFPFSYGE